MIKIEGNYVLDETIRILLEQGIKYMSIHLFFHSTNIYSVPSVAANNGLVSGDGENMRNLRVRMRN